MNLICNFDGLVGCTHNYAGLSQGNLASMTHKNAISNPQQAALQGLKQMKLVYDIVGIQGFLPPQMRPNFKLLHHYGFVGTEAKVLEKAYEKRPDILAVAWSASAMWTANAATVTITDKNHVHITPANLLTMRHRHQELEETAFTLKNIFYQENYFTHHFPVTMPDEGAANHMSIKGYDKIYDIFVYSPTKAVYPARQSLFSSQEIARNHECHNPIFLEQSIEAVNQGAFHNDVVAISHDNFIIYHEYAFSDDTLLPSDILKIKIPNMMLNLQEAIKTYLFNMRIIENNQNEYFMIMSYDVMENKNAQDAIDYIKQHNPRIKSVIYMDLQQSMANGGGSACLRFRVPLIEKNSVQQSYLLNNDKFNKLNDFVKNNYRDTVKPDDLRDIDFAYECLAVYDKFNDFLKSM